VASKNIKIGQIIGSFEFRVEAGKIRELALAIGDPNPVYYNSNTAREKGYRDIIASPTFGFAMNFWGGADFDLLVRALELNPLRILHGEQEFQYLGEINPGDLVQCCTTVSSIEEKKSCQAGYPCN